MCIRETHPCGGELVDVRRGDFACGVKALHVAVAEIVAEDINDIRPGRFADEGQHEQAEPKTPFACTRREHGTTLRQTAVAINPSSRPSVVVQIYFGIWNSRNIRKTAAGLS
jgi:hypothetical protein